MDDIRLKTQGVEETYHEKKRGTPQRATNENIRIVPSRYETRTHACQHDKCCRSAAVQSIR
jgi:hypothetical protein